MKNIVSVAGTRLSFGLLNLINTYLIWMQSEHHKNIQVKSTLRDQKEVSILVILLGPTRLTLGRFQMLNGIIVKKTKHPCQLPIGLIERLVLALSNPGDLVIDPYCGVGSSLIAALLHDRNTAGSDVSLEWLNIAQKRINLLQEGKLPIRPDKPVPEASGKLAKKPDEFISSHKTIISNFRI